MNSVMEKLAEVEETAEAIVEHARLQKGEIERRIQDERDQFDKELEEETTRKINKIRAESEESVEKVLDQERKKNQSAIGNLKKEYEENHEAYAEEILRHMIEVSRMGNVMAYSGITTKVRAMSAKLLTEKDFDTIAGICSVPEAIEYLKGKASYAPYVNKMDISLYHRGNVEKILYQSLFDDYSRIFRFAGMEQKTFLKLYWKRYEVDLINYCLRIVFNHYDKPFDLEYKKEFFDRYSQISIDRLITSKNIDELVDNLKDTEYYDALGRIRDSGAGTLFDYDLALDVYYFSTMWKKSKRLLKGREQKIFLKDYGTKIDLLNLQWIYRAKKYYHMLPPDIYSMTIPIHYRISLEEFKTLVETPTLEQFEAEVEKTYYARKYNYMQTDKTLEQMYKDCLRKLYLTDKRNDPYSIAIINTYLFLKEEEINKLTTALECIRYGLTKGETLGYLGGVNQ